MWIPHTYSKLQHAYSKWDRAKDLYTRSSAVAEMPRDSSRLSVVSFNITYCRATGRQRHVASWYWPTFQYPNAAVSSFLWLRLYIRCLATFIRVCGIKFQGRLIARAEIPPGPFTNFALLVARRTSSGLMRSRVHLCGWWIENDYCWMWNFLLKVMGFVVL